MGFGPFSSDSKSVSTLDQADERQFATDEAQNFNVKERSAYSAGDGFSLGGGFTNRSNFASGNAFSAAVDLRGDDNAIIFENLNAELATKSIDQVAAANKDALNQGLGFASSVTSELFKFTDEARKEASNALDSTRDYLANLVGTTQESALGLIKESSETSEQRITTYSGYIIAGLMGLAGLLVWRSL